MLDLKKAFTALFLTVSVLSTGLTAQAATVTGGKYTGGGQNGGPGTQVQTVQEAPGNVTEQDAPAALETAPQETQPETQAETQAADAPAFGPSQGPGEAQTPPPYVTGGAAPGAVQQASQAAVGNMYPNVGNQALGLVGFGVGTAPADSLYAQGNGPVTEDPVLHLVPDVHVQMLQMDGNLTDGFTTNMDMFTSGTDGICGLKLRLEDGVGDVYYRVYTDQFGWSEWGMNEMMLTYALYQQHVTAIQMRINGYTRNLFDFYYRVVLNDGTILDWTHDGMTAGTIGTGKYIQAMQVKLWKRGCAFPESTSMPMLGNYEGLVMENGNPTYRTASGAPYTGWAHDIYNNKYYFNDSVPANGWQYVRGYKYYFENGRVVTDLEPIIGLQSNYVLKLNKEMKTLTVYAKSETGKYDMPVKVILVTRGPATPIGTFKTYENFRWKFMHDDIYCQYLLRFKGGFLLHSIIYQVEPDMYHLTAVTYNQIGKNASDGCVRMRSGDAEWVYRNCGLNTELVIYEDYWSPGPFDRPAVEWAIPVDQNYDPTGPDIVNMVAQRSGQ